MARSDVEEDATSAPPPAKRVRFGDGHAAGYDSGQSSPADSGSSSAVPRPALEADGVIQLRFVRGAGDIHAHGARGAHDEALLARPTFTHQVYTGGKVRGFSEATAALYVTCASLACWLDVHTVELEDFVPEEGESVTDVRGMLWKLVLAGGVESREEFEKIAEKDKEYTPPFFGKPMMTYERDGREFSVFKTKLLSDPLVVDYHKRMQLLMFLHIDGANFIDSSDLRWELFVVLEHVGGAPRHLVGYATVYPFSAIRPGFSLDEGFAERIRISQVFVLPRFQRGGHGGKLLDAIYTDALQRKAIEVTVEDPSGGFRLLRDSTDLPRAYEAGILDPSAKLPSYDAVSDIVARLRTKLLITKTQARRCVEVHELRFVDRDCEPDWKKYRLWVKRRLYGEWQEVLDAFTGDDRKAKLGEIYEDYETEYLAVVDRLSRTTT